MINKTDVSSMERYTKIEVGVVGSAADPMISGLYPDAYWIGTGGTVVITTHGGVDITFANVANGTLIPISARNVKSGASNVVKLGV